MFSPDSSTSDFLWAYFQVAKADSARKALENPSVMASASSAKDLEQETMCCICKECMTEPVSVDCGHNFCRDCITTYFEKWEEMKMPVECPLCKRQIKKGSLRPNWQLANITEKLKLLPSQTAKGNLCVKHKKELNLFCKEDEELVCVACERSSEHTTHTVVMLEDAAKEYEVEIQTKLQDLKLQRANLLDQKVTEEQRCQKCLAQLRMEKQEMRSAFEKMEKFVQDKEAFCLALLANLKKAIENRQKDNLTRLSEEISSLTNLISEMEGKCQKPANELLQDIRSTRTKYQKGPMFKGSPDLEERLRSYSSRHLILKETMEKCQESLQEALKNGDLERPWKKVNVTLDPDTAHSSLVVSEDLRSVRWECTWQKLPNHPGRFDREPYVLGCERFTSGRHWWEVVVEARREQWSMWAVGVAKDSVRREGKTNLDPQEGIWAVGKNAYQFFVAFTSVPTKLNLKHDSRKVRVFLDYEEGCVEFFDACSDQQIFTFYSTSFCGEAIRPFFVVWDGVSLKC